MKVFDFGAFQNKMHMASREKYIFHILFGAFHGTPRTSPDYYWCILLMLSDNMKESEDADWLAIINLFAAIYINNRIGPSIV